MGSDRRPDLVSFTETGDGTIRVTDDVADEALEIDVPSPVALTPALPALFPVPIDDAVSVETDELTVAPHGSAYLRDENGGLVGEFSARQWTVERGTYYVDLSYDSKTYLRLADTSFTARYESGTLSPLTITFDEPTTVTIGARSLHTRPAATITVPDDPGALMDALSYAGSELKERSPERSWPTLRGHPPAFERGDELRVPDALTRPETGVTITVPAAYADIYRIAPLAHYLGATVEHGDAAALVLENGYTHPLRTRTRSLDASVEGVLARALLLDTLTRRAGYYSRPRYEYEDVAAHLPFYPEKLYDESISDALVEYLEVEDAVLERFDLTWPTVGVLPPSHDALPVLSPLLNATVPIHVTTGDGTHDRLFDATMPSHATTENPLGTARITRSAFENARDRPPRTTADTVLVTTDDRTAETVRERARSESWRRLDDVTVTSTLPATAPDCLVLDVPLDHPIRDDLRTTPSLSPRVFVARGADDLETALVANGVAAGVVLHGDPTRDELTELLAALETGVPIGTAATVSLSTPNTTVGDPRTLLRLRPNGTIASFVRVTSRTESTHGVDFHLFSRPQEALGGVGRSTDDSLPDRYQLTDCTATPDRTFDTGDVTSLLNDENALPVLNDALALGRHPITTDDVERSARRHLSDQHERRT